MLRSFRIQGDSDTHDRDTGEGQRVLNDRGPGFFYRRLIWLLLHPPLTLLPSASCLSFPVFLCVARRENLWERGRGGGGGATARKACPLLTTQNSLGKRYVHERCRLCRTHLVLLFRMHTVCDMTRMKKKYRRLDQTTMLSDTQREKRHRAKKWR
jgi:hypothetical protein